MSHSNFQKAEQVFWHDKILAKTILKLFPKKIQPNHLTVFRFLATPIVTTLMFYHHYSIGLIAFLIVSLTDALDGSMARTRGQITDWGKMYDPLADKVLIASMVFVIVLRYVDFWTSMVIVGLEFLIILVAWVRKSKGGEIQANVWGKIKMMLQVAGVTILLLSIIFSWDALLPFASGTLYLAIAFAVVSLLTYGI